MVDSRGNSGNDNSGNYNSGNDNSGNRNSGNDNSGNDNSGNDNSGNDNSGNRNSGNYNSGNRNSGYCNSGDRNSGYRNSGYCNSGDRNSGYYNSGDYHVGCFNTTDASQAYYFNVLSSVSDWDDAVKPDWIYVPTPTTWVLERDMTDKEKIDHADFHITGGFLRTNEMSDEWRKAYESATPEGVQQVRDLPNFDADVFKEITSLDLSVDKPETCAGKVVEIDGVKYKLQEIK